MRTIWKFPFDPRDGIKIKMPKGAVVLDVQAQRDVPCIWAIVDDKAEREERSFYLAGTGHPLRDSIGDYIGSFQLMGGALVFHLFHA